MTYSCGILDFKTDIYHKNGAFYSFSSGWVPCGVEAVRFDENIFSPFNRREFPHDFEGKIILENIYNNHLFCTTVMERIYESHELKEKMRYWLYPGDMNQSIEDNCNYVSAIGTKLNNIDEATGFCEKINVMETKFLCYLNVVDTAKDSYNIKKATEACELFYSGLTNDQKKKYRIAGCNNLVS
ncbi:MAG: hypothetical protein V1494_04155 [Candidatus Diapherotrites archaeon]